MERPNLLGCCRSATGKFSVHTEWRDRIEIFTACAAVALTWWAAVALGLLTILTHAEAPSTGQAAKKGMRLSDDLNDLIMHERHPRLGQTFLGEASVAWHDAVAARYFRTRTGMLRISPLGRNENHFELLSHARNGNCGDAVHHDMGEAGRNA